MNSGGVRPLTSRGLRIAVPLVVTALLLAACVESRPKIGIGLPSTYPGVSSAFDKRIKEQFPVGSDETLMLNELRKENFQIYLKDTLPSRYTSRARFTERQIVCDSTWDIQWSAESGRITAIVGSHGQLCL
jgi:hypothetical protein